MSKAVKKLIQSKIPDLSQYRDVSEFIMKSGNLSESEAEVDGPENQVILPQNISSRGNIASHKSSLRLIELGPRLKLQLIKIEEGLMEGEILFHELVEKSQEEIKILRAAKERKRKIKEKRRKQQEQNKRRKEDIKNEHKEHSLAGIKRKQELEKQVENYDEKDEDKQWFIQEVGEEPDPDLFISKKKKRLC
ncbi:suppressor of SWI4 1 homolog [Limulus polyphemus]|uniref:Suppressor of SWI4 1 homolog n=1 Tax=Limulus polyphemus TaxID=6850 RepID=A0ABM1SD75_LIMPO|nr:suppressor of SWI4 1 homolog [Limulus polyphemus]